MARLARSSTKSAPRVYKFIVPTATENVGWLNLHVPMRRLVAEDGGAEKALQFVSSGLDSI